MKKIMMTAFAGMLVLLSGCSQTEDPKYQDPNPETFRISTPGLADQILTTTADMTSDATFNLFTSQPDYGFAGVCKYSAIVSIDPTVPYTDEAIAAGQSIELENLNPNSAAMSFRTYALANAVCKMAGITEPEQYDNSIYDKGPVPVYFRAVCSIPAIEGSRVVSSNVVSYNQVKVVYSVLKPGWIYICGDVGTVDGAFFQKNGEGFLDPTSANAAEYDAHYRLMEPDDMAGEKLYVGKFMLNVKKNDAGEIAGGDTSDPDNASQFRFFTALAGWKVDASIGSHKDDFYCLPITENVANGAMYQGGIIKQGLGNWGIHITENKPITIVVDTELLNIFVVEGDKNVTFDGRTPSFN